MLLFKLISKALEHINELCSYSLTLLLRVFQALGRISDCHSQDNFPLIASVIDTNCRKSCTNLEPVKHYFGVVDHSHWQMQVVLKCIHHSLSFLHVRNHSCGTHRLPQYTNSQAFSCEHSLRSVHCMQRTLYLRRPLSTKTQCRRLPRTWCTSVAATVLSTPPDKAQMT